VGEEKKKKRKTRRKKKKRRMKNPLYKGVTCSNKP